MKLTKAFINFDSLSSFPLSGLHCLFRGRAALDRALECDLESDVVEVEDQPLVLGVLVRTTVVVVVVEGASSRERD
jgi:hypothetical protein